MTIERLREVLRNQPFQPFTLNLADGRTFAVPHPEYIAVSAKGRTVVVFDAETDAMEIIDLMMVVSLTVSEGGQAA